MVLSESVQPEPKESQKQPGLPATIRVAGLIYQVHHNPATDRMLDMANARGISQHDRLEIDVSTQLPIQRQQLTLLHECIHAIGSNYLQGNELTESQVASLSLGLYQVFKDNPGVSKFICAQAQDDDHTSSS